MLWKKYIKSWIQHSLQSKTPFIIKGQYDYNVLDQAHTTEDYEDFVGLVEKKVEALFDLYLSAM